MKASTGVAVWEDGGDVWSGETPLHLGAPVGHLLVFANPYPKKASSVSAPRRSLGFFLPSLERQIPLGPARHCARKHTKTGFPPVQLAITTRGATSKTQVPRNPLGTVLPGLWPEISRQPVSWTGTPWAGKVHPEPGTSLCDISKCL